MGSFATAVGVSGFLLHRAVQAAWSIRCYGYNIAPFRRKEARLRKAMQCSPSWLPYRDSSRDGWFSRGGGAAGVRGSWPGSRLPGCRHMDQARAPVLAFPRTPLYPRHFLAWNTLPKASTWGKGPFCSRLGLPSLPEARPAKGGTLCTPPPCSRGLLCPVL